MREFLQGELCVKKARGVYFTSGIRGKPLSPADFLASTNRDSVAQLAALCLFYMCAFVNSRSEWGTRESDGPHF
jgi:hypothetical protein